MPRINSIINSFKFLTHLAIDSFLIHFFAHYSLWRLRMFILYSRGRLIILLYLPPFFSMTWFHNKWACSFDCVKSLRWLFKRIILHKCLISSFISNTNQSSSLMFWQRQSEILNFLIISKLGLSVNKSSRISVLCIC